MCSVCRHPQRDAVEAALSSGRPLRALSADYPGLSKSALDRHRKRCAASHATVAPGFTATVPAVRRRSRPLIDEAERLDQALRMTAQGYSRRDVAQALTVHPSTVSELTARAKAAALERVRSETVEGLIVQRMAERNARVRGLHGILDDAIRRGDVRTQIEVHRELRHEGKEDREWMRDLGAFGRYRIPTAHEQEIASERSRGNDLQRSAIELFEEIGRVMVELDSRPEEARLMGRQSGPAGTRDNDPCNGERPLPAPPAD